jgi:hypothetical protein
MSGFFPGVMWQLYELTDGKQFWADKAQQWQSGLANKQVCTFKQTSLPLVVVAHAVVVDRASNLCSQAECASCDLCIPQPTQPPGTAAS